MNIYFILLHFYGIILRLSINANICSYTENAESVCCEGWVKNVYGDCIKSECFHNCGNGRCVGLNTCECFDGTIRSDTCPSPDKKSCPNDCSNKGKCQDWKCICNFGYTGLDCNTTLTSTCYVKVNRGLCKSTPEGLQLTREECCSIFQMAWGIPCQFCNERSSCSKGYMMKNGVCEDIDECQLRSICLNGQCINERGSFRCQCPPQYKLNENTMICQQQKDICEIFGSKCGLYGRCVPLITGDYKCICNEPYDSSEDGKECVKRRQYNVCKMFDKLCQPHGECQKYGMSYICKCQYGFIQSYDKKSCRINLSTSNTNNEDLCRNPEVSTKCINGQCISNADTYKCACYYPYQTSLDSQECVLNQITKITASSYCSQKEYYSLCQGGQCIDTYNGYYCRCSGGFKSSDNGRKCLRNEKGNQGKHSQLSNIYCSNKAYSSRCNGGQCIGDQIYGFKCICLSGFIAASDGRACHAVRNDPCRDNGYKCNPGSCRSVADYDFQCDCPSSFSKSEDGRRCYNDFISTRPSSTYCDIASYKERCATGECIPDNQYGFKCICLEGYKSSEDGRACHKIITQHPCSNNGYRCNPGRCRSIGEFDFQCNCPVYMVKSDDGRNCLSKFISTKPSSTYCDIASYRERCIPGECVLDEFYGFKCICPSDYTTPQDGRACNKIETSESVCQKYQSLCNGGICIERGNMEYECKCGQGYIKSNDGRSCQRKIKSICDTYGSRCLPGICYAIREQDYMCLCSSGYSPIDDSKACEKKTVESFCLKYQSNCIGGRCIDIDNDYKCECLPGYHKSGDSRSCIKDMQSMCDMYGSKCLNGVCYSHGEQDYFCICAMGYTPVDNNKACAKKTQNSLCSSFGYRCKGNTCIENGNDYKCSCSSGYIISEDQRSCEKIELDEKCDQVQDRCRDGFCFDISPGYICICSSNYFASVDGKYCNENEKIILKTNIAYDFPLLKSTSSKVCNSMINRKCHPGSCVDQNNSYSCKCPHSFTVSEDGKRCIRDSVECPHCLHGCQSKESNSKCLCPLDYEDILNTGLCLKSQMYLKYSLSQFQCNSEISKNKTFVITFNGRFSEDISTLESVHKDVTKLIKPTQLDRAKLNFCVPTRKQDNSLKEVKGKISWRVVCIFDC